MERNFEGLGQFWLLKAILWRLWVVREQTEAKILIRRKPKAPQYEHGAFVASEKTNYHSNCGYVLRCGGK